MTDDLKRRLAALRDLADPASPEDFRVEDAMKRGRKLRARWWMGTVSGAIALVALASLISAAVLASDEHRPDRDIAPVAGPPPQAQRAAVFASRALAQAGLLDPNGDVYDYYDIHQDGNNEWTALFNATSCGTDDSGTYGCKGSEPASMTVELNGNRWDVRSFQPGPGAPPEKADDVRAYHEPDSPLTPGWSFPAPKVAGPASRYVAAIQLWTGAVGAADQGSTCTAELGRGGGDVDWTSRPIDLLAPDAEDARSGGAVLFGGVPLDRTGGDTRIVCRPWSGKGWQPNGRASIDRLQGPDGPEWDVVTQAVWTDRPFAAARTICTASVYDADGNLLGQGDARVDPPADAQDPPYDRSVVIPVTPASGNDREPDSATVNCSLN